MFTRNISLFLIFTMVLMIGGLTQSYAFKPPDENNANNSAQNGTAGGNANQNQLSPAEVTAPINPGAAILQSIHKLSSKPNISVQGDEVGAAISAVENLMLQAGTEASFVMERVRSDSLTYRHIRLAQYWNGIPVVGCKVNVHINSQNEIYQIDGGYIPDINVNITPDIKGETALKIGMEELKEKHGLHVSKEPTLVIYNGRLAYHYVIFHETPDPGAWWYYVDAHTGKLIYRYNDAQRAAPTPGNGVHTTVSGNRLAGEDGTSVNITGWKENGGNFYQYNFSNLWGIYDTDAFDWEQNATIDWLTSDPPAVSAAKNFELTQDWIMNVFGRNSFDNAGALAIGNVHVGVNYVNAYWSPSAKQFYFGDGNGIIANALTVQDVVAHEYGHAVTQYTSGLIYSYESGALNESFSDILGAIVEFAYQPNGRAVYPDATPGHSDWLMGEDCWLPNPGDALRNMREPHLGSPPQPSYYKGTHWYYGAGDNGGVHYNSGVQNFAFYLLAEGGSGINDGHPYGPITGIGIVAAGEVAMRANTVYLTPSSQYVDSRAAWVSAATDLGYSVDTVNQVWDAVGVGTPPPPPPPPVPPKHDFMVVRELSATPGTYELEVFDIPTATNSDIGLPVASDNNIGTDIQDIAATKGIGDNLMMTRLNTVTGLYNLQIYKLPDDPGGDINLPVATDDDIGTGVYYVASGDFDSDPDDETAVVRLGADGITYELEIYNIPTITGGDTGLPVASDLDIGQNIQAVAAADFDGDKEEELVVVRLSADGVTNELEIFNVPVIVGGDTGLPIASDLDLGNDILIRGLGVGNFDDDAESEIAVARLNLDGVSSRLEIYDAPTTVGGDTGLPVASDTNIGTNVHAITTGIYLPANMEENFDDGIADGWLDDGSGLWSVQMVTANDGEYVSGPGMWVDSFLYSAYDPQIYTDFTYQVDVSRVSSIVSPNNGIMFRTDGTKNNGYLFGVSAVGQYMFGYYLNDVWNWITLWTPSTAINIGQGAWNTLKVVCSSSNIQMYINDTLVNSVTNTTFPSGKVGVMPAHIYSIDEVHYDNVLVLSATTCSLPVAGFNGSPTSGNVPLTVNFTDQSTNSPTGWLWNFGDGSTSTQQNPSHTYTTTGTYTVTLTATNECGSNQAVQVGYITVCNPPIAGFAGTPTTGDLPLTVAFTDQSANVPTSWSWDFGDGGTSTQQHPNHTYTTAGTYTVSLTSTNACGTDQAVQVGYITVTQPDIQNPTITITSPPQESEVSGIVNITVDAADNVGVVRVVYYIDETTIIGESTVAPFSFNWDTTAWADGEHKIMARAYDLVGNNEKDESQVLVIQPPCNLPVAGFVGTPTTGDVPLTVSFTDQSTNAPTSWSWDFGDGNTSTLQNPGHTYTTAGTYTVTLTATNSCGSDQVIQVGYITVTQPCIPPVAGFAGTPKTGDAPLTVSFTDQSTNVPTSWSWDFGDGNTSALQNPGHTYTTAGTYTVTLTATNACGTDQAVQVGYITVTQPPCDIPVAGFAGIPTTGDAPLTVSFTDQSTNTPTSWSWDFGDGNTSALQNPGHTYTTAGTYTVTLTATNACGTDQVVQVGYITVTQPPCDIPVAGFAGIPTTGDAPLTVSFTDQSTNTPTSWSWDFGDGVTSVEQNPNHTYTTAGTYTVSLTVTNACGTDQVVQAGYITVNQPTCTDPPVAEFTGSPLSGYPPLTVSFTDLSTNGATGWSWDFGDDGTSTAQNPVHTYDEPGAYKVIFTATNPCGSDEMLKEDYVIVMEQQE